MICPFCGADVSEDALTCYSCGASVDVAAAAAHVRGPRQKRGVYVWIVLGVVLAVSAVVFVVGKMREREQALCRRNMQVAATGQNAYFAGTGVYTSSPAELRDYVHDPRREQETREFRYAMDLTCPSTHEHYEFIPNTDRSSVAIRCGRHGYEVALEKGGEPRLSWRQPDDSL